MNWKKFFFAFIAAWIFVFAFGFVWYGNLMHGIHNEVPVLWRTETDFGSHFPWLVLGHAVMAFFLTLLYASFVASGGAGAGAKLGVMIAFLYIGNNLITFAVQPLTTKILAGWIVGGLLEPSLGRFTNPPRRKRCLRARSLFFDRHEVSCDGLPARRLVAC
jgi:hypothetical protein